MTFPRVLLSTTTRRSAPSFLPLSTTTTTTLSSTHTTASTTTNSTIRPYTSAPSSSSSTSSSLSSARTHKRPPTAVAAAAHAHYSTIPPRACASLSLSLLPSSPSSFFSASSSSSSSSSSDDTTGFWGDISLPHTHTQTQTRVPTHLLRFTTYTYLDSSSYIPFPHKDGIDARAFPTNPANFKVSLKVYVRDLDLDEREKKRFRCLVGSRYNPGKDELTLVSGRFMNRGHNKQYLLYLLDNLIAEAKGEKIAEEAL